MARRIAALLSIALLVACSNDPYAPVISDVAGEYDATTLTARTSSEIIDYMAAGSSMMLDLNDNGTVTGFLHVVGGAEGGGDLDADMAGTWTLSGATITFDQSADTFVRDVDFVATRDFRLVAEWSDQGVTIRLVLDNRAIVGPVPPR
jgi:hypothetical protein